MYNKHRISLSLCRKFLQLVKEPRAAYSCGFRSFAEKYRLLSVFQNLSQKNRPWVARPLGEEETEEEMISIFEEHTPKKRRTA